MIYDYLGINQDPLLQKLKRMKKGQQIVIGELTIYLNKLGLFEISSENYEECCSNVTKCYQKVCLLEKSIAN